MRSHSTGFALIEVVIVLGLVAVIASFGVAVSYGALARTSASQERDLFVTLLLRSTRAAALVNTNQQSHGVFIDNDANEYVLFSGTTYDDSNPDNRSIPFTSDAVAVNNTGGDIIVFEQLSGEVITGAGTISISSGDASQAIYIRETGQIDW